MRFGSPSHTNSSITQIGRRYAVGPHQALDVLDDAWKFLLPGDLRLLRNFVGLRQKLKVSTSFCVIHNFSWVPVSTSW
jgi:hypothetical protein